MPSTLVFPDGIRLAREDEIPGPEPARSNAWARIQSASIAPGFVLKPTGDERFSHYSEINVDAPRIWAVFRDLCRALLGPDAAFIAGEIDAAPLSVGSAEVTSLLASIEPHKYQLAHDGFVQFGLASDGDGVRNEVFVTPTKHFQVWLNHEESFRSIMRQYELREAQVLEFIDEYPRTTIALSPDAIVFPDPIDLIKHLEDEIAAIPNGGA